MGDLLTITHASYQQQRAAGAGEFLARRLSILDRAIELAESPDEQTAHHGKRLLAGRAQSWEADYRSGVALHRAERLAALAVAETGAVVAPILAWQDKMVDIEAKYYWPAAKALADGDLKLARERLAVARDWRRTDGAALDAAAAGVAAHANDLRRKAAMVWLLTATAILLGALLVGMAAWDGYARLSLLQRYPRTVSWTCSMVLVAIAASVAWLGVAASSMLPV